ncbi:MAG: NADH:flavin oxidoreductase/NADH oxidase [Bacteroidetes bacterium]|nr:NADH:flavin oxidoreductase/NADH oxidase [Bacteroidota bacterium]
MSQLFTPLQIRSLTLRHRLVVSPMCQYSATDGYAGDWHFAHLAAFAVGGAAVVFTEATAVNPEGRISPQDLGLWTDDQIAPLQRITSFLAEHGAIPGIQLAHAGRKASTSAPWLGDKPVTKEDGGWTPVAPSAVPFREGNLIPSELTIAQIKGIVQDFQDAARRALAAGFRILEIHGAHGYLITEFLSPFSNHRRDEYGGSFENRTQFLLEIIDAIRQVWPTELPLFLRISATEWKEGGWSEADSVALAKIVGPRGVDLIDCSSGGNVPGVKIPIVPMYQTPLAEHIKKEAGIMTGAVGLITTSAEAESIIADGRADLVFMAREMLRDPHFPLRAAHELSADITWPKQYERAKWKK